MKRAAVILLLTTLLFTLGLVPQAAADNNTAPDIESGIAEINKHGNIVLTISPESMIELGYEPADIISVKIGDAETEMPIGTNYSDVDIGNPICCFKSSDTKGINVVVLAINTGDFATTMGIAERRDCEEEPGYKWVYADGLEEPVTVRISMAEKQGYANEYLLHRISGTRTNNREDYAQLSDAEYANFRAVETGGMGKGTLLRSSSPIDPVINRSKEADEALLRAAGRTVMNMADSEEEMKKYPDFSLSYYAGCDVIALSMGMDCFSADFEEELAEGFRFLASHDGPYLIHCREGKERTGFAAGILECLMGADADEVVKDYMLTYYNYYGVEPGTEEYERIAGSNIETSLAKAFGIESVRADGADLQSCAETYLERIGMSRDEIDMLKSKLGEDCGGLS